MYYILQLWVHISYSFLKMHDQNKKREILPHCRWQQDLCNRLFGKFSTFYMIHFKRSGVYVWERSVWCSWYLALGPAKSLHSTTGRYMGGSPGSPPTNKPQVHFRTAWPTIRSIPSPHDKAWQATRGSSLCRNQQLNWASFPEPEGAPIR